METTKMNGFLEYIMAKLTVIYLRILLRFKNPALAKTIKLEVYNIEKDGCALENFLSKIQRKLKTAIEERNHYNIGVIVEEVLAIPKENLECLITKSVNFNNEIKEMNDHRLRTTIDSFVFELINAKKNLTGKTFEESALCLKNTAWEAVVQKDFMDGYVPYFRGLLGLGK